MTFIARLTRNVFIWAVIGLLIGLLLVAVDVMDNPFWGASAGIMVAAIFTGTRRLASARGAACTISSRMDNKTDLVRHDPVIRPLPDSW